MECSRYCRHVWEKKINFGGAWAFVALFWSKSLLIINQKTRKCSILLCFEEKNRLSRGRVCVCGGGCLSIFGFGIKTTIWLSTKNTQKMIDVIFSFWGTNLFHGVEKYSILQAHSRKNLHLGGGGINFSHNHSSIFPLIRFSLFFVFSQRSAPGTDHRRFFVTIKEGKGGAKMGGHLRGNFSLQNMPKKWTN